MYLSRRSYLPMGGMFQHRSSTDLIQDNADNPNGHETSRQQLGESTHPVVRLLSSGRFHWHTQPIAPMKNRPAANPDVTPEAF
jgi:hypothetical protein